MAKNLIPEICKMLGVELGEEFKVVYKVGVEIICNFTKEGVFVQGCSVRYNKELLADIIYGKVEIVKLPWKPKEGDAFYTFDIFSGKWVVVRSLWRTGAPCNYALLDKGWVFRTKEEAEDALTKVAEELGVEYEI